MSPSPGVREAWDDIPVAQAAAPVLTSPVRTSGAAAPHQPGALAFPPSGGLSPRSPTASRAAASRAAAGGPPTARESDSPFVHVFSPDTTRRLRAYVTVASWHFNFKAFAFKTARFQRSSNATRLAHRCNGLSAVFDAARELS